MCGDVSLCVNSQYYALHIFYYLEQVHLSTDKLGQSVDECDALLKKHEAFERLIISQEEKVAGTIKSIFLNLRVQKT